MDEESEVVCGVRYVVIARGEVGRGGVVIWLGCLRMNESVVALCRAYI